MKMTGTNYLDYYVQAVQSLSKNQPVAGFLGIEAAFLAIFTLIVLGTAAQATAKRTIGVVLLAALSYAAEGVIVPLCQRSERPHWAATISNLLGVQFISASELVLVSRLHAAQLPLPSPRGSNKSEVKAKPTLLARSKSAIGLLWSVRRVGTPWQAKNIPPAPKTISRLYFITQRLVTTALMYLFVDVVVSLPPPPPEMLAVEKGSLVRGIGGLTVNDIIFRTTMTASFWLIIAVLNLFMTNTGAIVSVLLGLSKPEDCPPLHGSFAEAYTVRRFWGISWHQMFRVFLTGHADLLVDPILPRPSLISRYTRILVAFLISGLLHYRADILMGMSTAESGAMLFFTMHAAVIMVEDAVGPLLSKVWPSSRSARLRRVLCYLWVCAFFIWTTPVYMYPANRLGLNAAAMLPVRILGPLVEQSLPKP